MATGKPRRDSRQRQILFEALCALDTHPTAADLHRSVRARLPRLSLGTVYRNLEILRQEGLVRKLGDVGGTARFDATLTPHDHAQCRVCGQLVDVPAPPPGRASPPPELAGFRVEGRRLQYFGVCADCQRQDSDQGAPRVPVT